ncbi:tetratricopeptide repeat protein [Celeribacter neptunius]|uniref:TPR repeat-containing protein n=1 Tax=Celeribacter neptunius TaxID=588602 RepID=A0A1I3ISK3_9RHOB|nr:tetratricopeptide repeat protein [Celeribacter neptunius]SFI50783.1 TPR repeat-containing protein [Celeribacter neptunius]
MKGLRQFLKCAVTFGLIFAGTTAFAGSNARLDELFGQLSGADPFDAGRIESEIALEMARSGSDSMDLLLERGRMALEAGDISGAIGHLTALVDHAPEFTEAYNTRATAYFMAGLYGPALKDIGQVLTREPRHFGALSGLALILEDTGDAPRALEVLLKIQEIHPNMEGLADRIARLQLALEGTAL